MKKLIMVYSALMFVNSIAATWTTFDSPNLGWIKPTSIEGNTITGSYASSSGDRGFIYDGTTWTSLSAPDSAGTWTTGTYAYGSSGNIVVGNYNSANSSGHGFIYNGSTWANLDFPGANWTKPFTTNGSITVGSYLFDHGGSLAQHGFIYDGTTWTTINVPDLNAPFWTTNTSVYGFDGNNMVGNYDTFNGSTHGFLYDGMTWTQLDFPGANWTKPTSIQGNIIVGSYLYDHGGYLKQHGFIYDGLTWTTLDVPDNGSMEVSSTSVYGLDGNNIVGNYDVRNGGTHGFIYNIPEPSTIIMLFSGAFLLLRRRK